MRNLVLAALATIIVATFSPLTPAKATPLATPGAVQSVLDVTGNRALTEQIRYVCRRVRHCGRYRCWWSRECFYTRPYWRRHWHHRAPWRYRHWHRYRW